MANNTVTKAILVVCMSAMLCACSGSPTVSGDSDIASEQPDISQSTSSITAQTTTSGVISDTTTQPTINSEPDEAVIGKSDIDFVPVLTEDDLEYMGIPYKDLTVEQFIRMWAQATRECNFQRLYVITYYNCAYSDETGETIEQQSEQFLKENIQQQIAWACNGFMPYRYSDVELLEDSQAPEGYYDNADGEELCYVLQHRDIGYYPDYDHESVIDTRWITLKKINGYWKIGVMMSSSPPAIFLPNP